MPETDLSILINAPVEEVFEFVANPANTTRYQREFSRFETLDGPRIGVGSTVDARGKFMGIPVRTKLRVVEFVPNERIVSKSVAHLKSWSEWHFQPEDSGTLVRFVASFEWPIPIPSAMVRRLLKDEIDRITEDSLRRLKSLVEGSQTGVS